MPVEVPLTRGLVALVDDADADRVLAHRWCSAGEGIAGRYAMRRRKSDEPDTWGRSFIRLHHFIFGRHPGLHVDHINGDSLDNQRANLRACTRTDNLRNQRSRRDNAFKGVHAVGSAWICRFREAGRVRYLGTFLTAEAAAHAYDEAALRVHGAFARLNFPRPAPVASAAA